MDRDAVVMNGHDLEKCFLPIESRLRPDLAECEPSLP